MSRIGNHPEAKQKLRLRLFEEQGGLCHLCSTPMAIDRNDPRYGDGGPYFATFDHILPRSAGGTNRQTNLALAHKKCNGIRGSLSLEELNRRREIVRRKGVVPK